MKNNYFPPLCDQICKINKPAECYGMNKYLNEKYLPHNSMTDRHCEKKYYNNNNERFN